MKSVIITCLLLIVSNPLFSEETRTQGRTGEAAGYASRDATVLSAMGWGLGIIVGIATLFSLLDNNPSSSSSHSH